MREASRDTFTISENEVHEEKSNYCMNAKADTRRDSEKWDPLNSTTSTMPDLLRYVSVMGLGR